jgi:hypothetical protein
MESGEETGADKCRMPRAMQKFPMELLRTTMAANSGTFHCER